MPLVVYVSSAKAKLDRPPDKFRPPSMSIWRAVWINLEGGLKIATPHSTFYQFQSNKKRPIGQFAGYNIPTSLINTGDVGISNV